MSHDLANLFHLKVLKTVFTKLCNDYHFCSRGLKMLAELEIETWLKVGCALPGNEHHCENRFYEFSCLYNVFVQ